MLLKTVLHVGQRQDRDKASKKSKGKLLSPPVPRKCSESEWASASSFSSHLFFLGPKRFRFQGHNYFYSGDVAPYKKIKYDWLDGRNFCRWLLMVNCRCHCNQPQKTREYCMDLVSLETQQENDYIQNWLESRNLTYTWTSGRYVSLYYQSLPSPMNFRLCDFDGCDRPDLKPINIKGWFWTGSNKKIAPTNKVNEG